MARSRLAVSPRQLSLCGHRVRTLRVPYVLVLQHRIVSGPTCIVAPVVAAGAAPVTLLSPGLTIRSLPYRVIMLNMVAAETYLLDEAVAYDDSVEDAVAAALDAIFRGYPVGIPLA